MDNSKVIRYCLVGVLTAVLQFTLVFVGVDGLHLGATLTSSVTFVIIIIFNYLMHYNWTYGVPAPHSKALTRYLVMTFCGFLLNGFIMYFGTALTEVNYLLVQAVAFAVIIIWNFCLSSFWVFKD
jgi:putative flippase GtrA